VEAGQVLGAGDKDVFLWVWCITQVLERLPSKHEAQFKPQYQHQKKKKKKRDLFLWPSPCTEEQSHV
jgi:hypothetical protein